MAETGPLEDHNWAVFEETTSVSDNWFQSTNTAGESVCIASNDEWQDFGSTGSSHTNSIVDRKDPVKDLNGITVDSNNTVTKVMKDCFPVTSLNNNNDLTQPVNLLNTEDKSLLTDLQTTVISLTNFEWSRCLIKDQFLLSLVAMEQESREKQKDFEEADLSGFDDFDWSLPNDPAVPEQRESVELDNGGVRFSPEDEFQGLFRQPCNRLDSPIELEFDHGKAVLGLSMLPMSDLTTMRNEMSGKITKLSNDLVSLLQNRDLLYLETVTKNRFIQAMLRVQESKHAMQNTSLSLTGSMGSLVEPGTEGREQPSSSGEDARYKRRSRSRSSIQHLSRSIIAKAKNLRSVEDDKATNDMLLRVVIPYKDNTLGTRSVPLLKKWTKILLAMADKNPNVTSLVSEYLTSVIESETDAILKSETNAKSKSIVEPTPSIKPMQNTN